VDFIGPSMIARPSSGECGTRFVAVV
jgi:hypothetical protein